METTTAKTTIDKLNVSHRDRLPAADADLVRQFAEWQASVDTRPKTGATSWPHSLSGKTWRQLTVIRMAVRVRG